MTRNRQLVLLTVLLSAAAALIWNQYYGVLPASDGNGAQSRPSTPDLAGDRIHKLGSPGDATGGLVNLFTFRRQAIRPEVKASEEIVIQTASSPRTTITDTQRAEPVIRIPLAAEPPNISLQYTGYARADDNRMVAFLEASGDGILRGFYNLRETDYLMGRFRVSGISADAVEVEDMARDATSPNRKQRIAINPALAVRR